MSETPRGALATSHESGHTLAQHHQCQALVADAAQVRVGRGRVVEQRREVKSSRVVERRRRGIGE